MIRTDSFAAAQLAIVKMENSCWQETVEKDDG
jgi:hypothetical protein